MASHRYWRLSVSLNWGASSCGVGGMELRAVSGGTNLSVTGNGTASASDEGGGGSSNAFDSNDATYWSTSFITSGWVKWDFGSGNAQTITSLTIVNMPSGQQGNSPRTAMLQFSDDNSTWVDYIVVTSPGNTAGQRTEYLAVTATMDVTMPAAISEALGGAQVAAAMSFAVEMNVGAPRIEVAMPMPIVVLQTAGTITAAMPSPAIVMTVPEIAPTAIEAVMPMPVVAMATGAAVVAAMPMPTASMSVTGDVVARIEAVMPMPEVAMSVLGGGVVAIEASLGTLVVNMVGAAAIEAVMPAVQATMQVMGGGTVTITAAMPVPVVTLSVSDDVGITIEATMPAVAVTPYASIAAAMPMARVTLTVEDLVAIAYEAYAVNLQPSAGYREAAVHEVTRYTGLQFDHIIRWRNQYYGVKANGLYLLGGDLDGTAKIPWAFETGQSNLGSYQLKAVRELFVHGRVGPGFKASATIVETTRKTYAGEVLAGSKARATRVKLGRGLKADYWSFGLSDPDGGPCDIDTLQLDAAELTRKVY